MIKIPYEKLISRIIEKTQLSEEEIERRVKEKQDSLSGLVSKEGAAHIVANEMGIGFTGNNLGGRLKVSEVLPGMRDIEVAGRVMNVYDIRLFNSKGREGKVGSVVIGDDTGTMRLVMWNDQTENIAKLKAGDVVRVVNAYAKERMDGSAELHLSDRSRLAINPLGELVSEVKLTANVQRKEIAQINEADRNVEVLGTIVQVFDIRFFPICPGCGKKARQKDNEFVCEAHGKVQPGYSYVTNLFLDDGTDSIRVTFFREQVLELTEKGHEEVLGYRDAPALFEDVKTDLLGRIIKVNGRVTKNAMFNSLELIANSVELNPNT